MLVILIYSNHASLKVKSSIKKVWKNVFDAYKTALQQCEKGRIIF